MHGLIIKLILIVFFFSAPVNLLAQEKVDWSRSKAESAKPADFIPAIFEQAAIESFEGAEFPPNGWSKITNNDGAGWQRITVGSEVPGFEGTPTPVVEGAPGGGGAVAMASWLTGDADSLLDTGQPTDQWLITPQVQNVQAGDSLKFYLKYFSIFSDNLDVWFSTAVDTIAFTVADTTDTLVTTLVFTGTSSNDWTRYCFGLTDFVDSGTDIFIAFREHVQDTENEGDALFLDLVDVAGLITSVSESPELPSEFVLKQNYPNPFNPSTRISFSLPQSSKVTLTVHNLLGQVVATLLDEVSYSTGSYDVQFDAANLPNGIYFYKIAAGSFREVKKMTLLK
ncbi:T9SS type A sorting domain-containing protein [candidate division KSB1 bacterium]|nr:T9SS type A sorting domain-containing protein [candidate division KSB1 bacterium]